MTKTRDLADLGGGFIQSGTGALQRTVESKLQDVVSVKDFIPSGIDTSTTDCTSYFQAAINKVGGNGGPGGALYIPFGTYLIGGTLQIEKFIHIEGNNSTLVQPDNYIGKLINQYLVNEQLDTAQDSRKFVIKDLRLLRNSLDVGQDDPLLGSMGLYLRSANINLYNVRTENFNVGVYIQRAQFGTAYSLKHYNCNVGLFIKNDPTNGGGNSWSFYDHQAFNSKKAAVMVINASVIGGVPTLPLTALYFRNVTWNVGKAGLAAWDSNVYIDGGAPEDNWQTGSSTVTFDGKTIPRSTIYCNNSRIRINNLTCAEGNANPVEPFIQLANKSICLIEDIEGYGFDQGSYITHDGTCFVKLSTLFEPNGHILDQVVTTSSMTKVRGHGFAVPGPASVYNDYTLTNQCTTGANAVDPFDGAAVRNAVTKEVGTIWDANFGRVARFTFTRAAGNPDTNSLQFCSTEAQTSGNYSVLGVTLKSDIDARFRIGITGPGELYWGVRLRAGVATRVYMVCNAAVQGGQVFFMSATADGFPEAEFVTTPVVEVTQMMYITAPSNAAGVAKVNDVLKGAFNGNFKPSFYGRTATSVPTTGTWEVGDIVWNRTPIAGGTLGWVCTTGGGAGTFVFKTFGTIAAA